MYYECVIDLCSSVCRPVIPAAIRVDIANNVLFEKSFDVSHFLHKNRAPRLASLASFSLPQFISLQGPGGALQYALVIETSRSGSGSNLLTYLIEGNGPSPIRGQIFEKCVQWVYNTRFYEIFVYI
jgi:hypothetical protein